MGGRGEAPTLETNLSVPVTSSSDRPAASPAIFFSSAFAGAALIGSFCRHDTHRRHQSTPVVGSKGKDRGRWMTTPSARVNEGREMCAMNE